MNYGFYPALGTPVDRDGGVLTESLTRHVEDQVANKAAGLLVMGTMGVQPMIRDREYVKVAATSARAAGGACPVYVGVMDNSISRVRDRIDSLRDLPLDGVVATAPFYFVCSQEDLKAFYRSIADSSPFPLYLYDLPGVTQVNFKASTVLELATHPNIAGIKSGNLALVRVVGRSLRETRPGFEILYSGLDTFDAACAYGIGRNLDGMFSCTAALSSDMYAAVASGDGERAAQRLDEIVGLRDVFVEVGIFPGFTCAMNLLGFEGRFQPDYTPDLTPAQAEKVKNFMQQVKLI